MLNVFRRAGATRFASAFLWAALAVFACVASRARARENLPLKYEALRVPNSCMVDAIHFYDLYRRKFPVEKGGWARVLRWGNEDGDIKISTGHAVTIFTANGKVWSYDINFGIQPLALPVERHGDITDVSPLVFVHYPQFRPIFARYVDDFPQTPPKKRPEFIFYHAVPDVRAATKVAHELASDRPVRIVEFSFKSGGKVYTSAAAAFFFSGRLCLYFPRHGTYMAPHLPRDIAPDDLDDLHYITAVIHRLYPEVGDVHWQAGGYWLFPPKEKKSTKN